MKLLIGVIILLVIIVIIFWVRATKSSSSAEAKQSQDKTVTTTSPTVSESSDNVGTPESSSVAGTSESSAPISSLDKYQQALSNRGLEIEELDSSLDKKAGTYINGYTAKTLYDQSLVSCGDAIVNGGFKSANYNNNTRECYLSNVGINNIADDSVLTGDNWTHIYKRLEPSVNYNAPLASSLASKNGIAIAEHDSGILKNQSQASCGQELINGGFKSADYDNNTHMCYLSNVGLDDAVGNYILTDSKWRHIYRRANMSDIDSLGILNNTGIAGYDASVLNDQTQYSCGRALIDGAFKTADYNSKTKKCYLSRVGIDDIADNSVFTDSNWTHIYSSGKQLDYNEPLDSSLSKKDGVGIAGHDAGILKNQSQASCGRALIDGAFKTADYNNKTGMCYLSNVGLDDASVASNIFTDADWTHMYTKKENFVAPGDFHYANWDGVL